MEKLNGILADSRDNHSIQASSMTAVGELCIASDAQPTVSPSTDPNIFPSQAFYTSHLETEDSYDPFGNEDEFTSVKRFIIIVVVVLTVLVIIGIILVITYCVRRNNTGNADDFDDCEQTFAK